MSNINVETWDKVYSEKRSLLVWPDENVVTFINRNRKLINTGIDIACGAGRHAIFMAEMGIDAWGVDSSESAIVFAKERAQKQGLTNVQFAASLVQDMKFEDGKFDFAITWGLFHYLTKEDQQALLSNIRRILRPEGMLLCTLRSVEDSRAKAGKEVEENRYLVDYFDEETKTPKQTLMYFWDENGVRKFFEGFKNISLGHRALEPIGRLGNKTGHWLISVQK